MFCPPPYPALPLHLAWDFARSESFSLGSRSALRCRTFGQSRPWLGGLVPLMGKASVSNITVSSLLFFVPKALAMARLSAFASPLAILHPPPSRFRRLPPYCPISWHLTANPLHRLAPYCSAPAGTLLLIIVGWHPLSLWLRSPTCLSPSCDLLYGSNPRLGYG